VHFPQVHGPEEGEEEKEEEEEEVVKSTNETTSSSAESSSTSEITAGIILFTVTRTTAFNHYETPKNLKASIFWLK